MFTCIPIHEEAAKRLVDFKDRSDELAARVVRMHDKDKDKDKDKGGSTRW